MTATIRTYSDLVQHQTFEERFRYLSLRGGVGEITFGFDRWINQQFYQSRQWKQARRTVILRDEGCDLGVEGHEISIQLLVHHMNPMTPKEIEAGVEGILDPEFLITTTFDTHNAIHYGDENLLKKPFVARSPGDTKLW